MFVQFALLFLSNIELSGLMYTKKKTVWRVRFEIKNPQPLYSIGSGPVNIFQTLNDHITFPLLRPHIFVGLSDCTRAAFPNLGVASVRNNKIFVHDDKNTKLAKRTSERFSPFYLFLTVENVRDL